MPPATINGFTSTLNGRGASLRSAAHLAHGFLTLALMPMWLAQCVPLEARMSVNYGLNRVRFMAPVRVGSRPARDVHRPTRCDRRR